MYPIVVSEEAQELKQGLEDKIAEWREQEEQELELLLESLSRELTLWLDQKAEKQLNQCLQGSSLIVGVFLALAVWPQVRQRQKQ